MNTEAEISIVTATRNIRLNNGFTKGFTTLTTTLPRKLFLGFVLFNGNNSGLPEV
jgi:hypothetical protein